jgi:O-antigen ligase
MATMSIGAVVLGAFLLIEFRGPAGLFQALREETRTRAGRLYWTAARVLSLACLLSVMCLVFWPVVFDGRYSEVHLLRDASKLWYLFWPLPLAVALRRLKAPERTLVLRAWLIAFGILSAIGIQQFFTGWPREQNIPDMPGRFHAILFLGHHLSVASVFIFPFFVALDAYRKRMILPRWALGPILAFAAVTMAFTFSRALWVAVPIGILVWLLLTLRSRWSWVAMGAVVLALVGALQFSTVSRRVFNHMGIKHREELWATNWEFFKERPLTGIGWRHNEELGAYYQMMKNHTQDVFTGHAHDNLLDMLGSAGLIGAVAWVFYCGVIFWILIPLIRQRDPRGFAVGLFCAWVVFQLNGITQVNFWEGKVEHQMAWAIAWSLLFARVGSGDSRETLA